MRKGEMTGAADHSVTKTTRQPPPPLFLLLFLLCFSGHLPSPHLAPSFVLYLNSLLFKPQ